MVEQVRIGLCDDQPAVLQELHRILSEVCKEREFAVEFSVFTDGNELLKQIDDIDIAFLDIEMPGMDGIELGKRINVANPNCKVIMATGKVERFKEAFHIHALRFVTKPFEKTEVEESLLAALESLSFGKFIEVFAKRNRYEIPQDEIMYIKAFNGYSEIYTHEMRFRRECSLLELEPMLDERIFVRINRDIIVNLCWIQEYEKEQIKLGAESFDISRRRKKEFEHKYIEFDLKYRDMSKR